MLGGAGSLVDGAADLAAVDHDHDAPTRGPSGAAGEDGAAASVATPSVGAGCAHPRSTKSIDGARHDVAAVQLGRATTSAVRSQDGTRASRSTTFRVDWR